MTPGPSRSASSDSPATPEQMNEQALVNEVIRLSRNVLGLTLGMLLGFGLFLATVILVLKGGPHVGQHLGLLNHFFPGYRVTFAGSFLGFGYGLIIGYLSGWIIASVYNWVAFQRQR